MKLQLIRISSQEDDTLGALFLDGVLECFTLEDEYREIKVPGETRIPAGIYQVKLRLHGGFYERYTKRFPWHRGMLQIMDVPGFEDILIHMGNTDKDTAGCILVGDEMMTNVERNGFVGRSEIAYTRLYPKIAGAIEAGNEVTIEIKDIQL